MKSLTPYEPWSTLYKPPFDLYRPFGFGREDGWEDGSNVATSRWMPAVDIKEENAQFVITADVPGVEPKDIDVTMENGILTIKGERRLETEGASDGFRRTERLYGTFYRRFSLPDYADADRISAKCQNGVLEVVVPKTEKVRPRRIEVH